MDNMNAYRVAGLGLVIVVALTVVAGWTLAEKLAAVQLSEKSAVTGQSPSAGH